MRSSQATLLLLGALCGSALAGDIALGKYDVAGAVDFTVRNPKDGKKAPPSPAHMLTPATRVTIDGGAREAMVQADGSFVFRSLPAGSYLLEVFNPAFMFEPLRVDIDGQTHVVRAATAGIQSKSKSVPVPMRITPLGFAQLFEVREQFNAMAMLSNPMVLMMGFSLMMMMMMRNMDPEMMKEMQQQQREQMEQSQEMMAKITG